MTTLDYILIWAGLGFIGGAILYYVSIKEDASMYDITFRKSLRRAITSYDWGRGVLVIGVCMTLGVFTLVLSIYAVSTPIEDCDYE